MPRAKFTPKQRLGLVRAVALTGAALVLGGLAQASDLYEPYGRYGPPAEYHGPPPGPVYGQPRYLPPAVERHATVGEPACRIFHRRRIDPYGREFVQRVRVCEEGVVAGLPRWAARSPGYGYEPYVYGVPRPPRTVGPDYDDLD